MSKNIELDKFYTPTETAKRCVGLMLNVVTSRFFVTEYLEPSAGSGNFSNLIEGCIAYDIKPTGRNIIEVDFLKLNIPYKEGRLIFGNPPFGDRNNLARSFYKKATELCDAIAFILPISQLNNSDSLYEFDLIKSVDLGVLEYSGMKIHCCFNIYTRPKNRLNSKPNLKIDWIKIYRDDQDGYENINADLCIFRRGASAGKEKLTDTHTQTYKIVVDDKSKVEYVKDKILNFDWSSFKKHQSAPSLSKNDIYRLFKSEGIKK
jgi:hypothetical protein